MVQIVTNQIVTANDLEALALPVRPCAFFIQFEASDTVSAIDIRLEFSIDNVVWTPVYMINQGEFDGQVGYLFDYTPQPASFVRYNVTSNPDELDITAKILMKASQ